MSYIYICHIFVDIFLMVRVCSHIINDHVVFWFWDPRLEKVTCCSWPYHWRDPDLDFSVN